MKGFRGLLVLMLMLLSALPLFAKVNGANEFQGKIVHFYPPAGWPSYGAICGNSNTWVGTLDAEGWVTCTWTANSYEGFFFRSGGSVLDGWDYKYGPSGASYPGGVGVSNQGTWDETAWPTGKTEIWIVSGPAPTYTPTILTAKPPVIHIMNPADWDLGAPKLALVGNAPVFMQVDRARCGWFTYMLLMPAPFSFHLVNSQDNEAYGASLGYGDSTNWTLDIPNFSANSQIWLEPDEVSGKGFGLFSTSDPNTDGTCSYSLAAIVRDFDAVTDPDFYTGGTPQNCAGLAKNGLVRGIVEPVLGADRKPVQSTTQPATSKCFQNFKYVFNTDSSANPINTETCVDMPMSKTSDGLWEFDAMNEPSKNYLPIDNLPGPHNIQYLSCVAPPHIYLTDDTPTDSVGPADYDWNTGNTPPNGMHNFNFCFETHADFIYQPGQSFAFRGDDDVWVFINNKLVVDLGGLHVPLPAKVNLDTLGLTVGKTYPFDFFFCERMPCGSNVRLKTSMYFEQKKSLFFEQSGNTYTVKKLQGGGGSCSAIKSGGGVDTVLGSTLNLLYTLVSTRGDTIDGDPTTAAMDSHLISGQKIYGGIIINNGVVTLDTTTLAGLPPGRYKLNIQEVGNLSVKASILIKIAGTTAFWSANGDTTIAGMAKNPIVDKLVGRMVPFQVANKSGDFIDSSNTSFQLSIPTGLLVYMDSLGTQPIANLQIDSTGVAGVVTLWATGSKVAADTATYAVSIRGSRSPALNFKFHQPRLEFVTDSLSTTALLDPKPAFGGDSLNFAYINFPTYLLAYDPANGAACSDCADTLTPATNDSLAFSAPDGSTLLRLVNGRAVVLVRGTNKVTNGSFTVTGSSALMTAAWSPINLDLPPVPVPKDAGMYDKDGNGIADSLHILFDRSIMANDSTPDSLIIRWPSTAPDTTRIHGKDSVRRYLSDANTGLSIPYSYSQENTSGVGNADIWFTFTKNGKTIHSALSETIADRMGPIVRSARVHIATPKAAGIVYDTVLVVLSEPVDTTGLGASTDLPFEFVILSAANGLTPHAINTSRYRWNSKLDSVRLFYDPTVEHPRVGDSVRVSVFGSFILKDPLGNARSILNPLVRIEGDKRNEVQSISLTGYDPTDPLVERRKILPATFVQKVSMYESLDSIKAGIRAKSGPVLGHLIKTDLADIFAKNQSAYAMKNKGAQLQAKDVVLHYRVDYYTSLGGYVAEGKGSISCADTAMFGKGGCLGSEDGYVFVGWNLTSDNGRLVGSGAYVARLETWVTIETVGKAAGFTVNSDQTWGVVRSKGKAIFQK